MHQPLTVLHAEHIVDDEGARKVGDIHTGGWTLRLNGDQARGCAPNALVKAIGGPTGLTPLETADKGLLGPAGCCWVNVGGGGEGEGGGGDGAKLR